MLIPVVSTLPSWDMLYSFRYGKQITRISFGCYSAVAVRIQFVRKNAISFRYNERFGPEPCPQRCRRTLSPTSVTILK